MDCVVFPGLLAAWLGGCAGGSGFFAALSGATEFMQGVSRLVAHGLLNHLASGQGGEKCYPLCATLQGSADGRALMRQCDELLAFLKELDAAQLATAAAQRRKEQLQE